MTWVLAIDFGSANTAAAWARGGRIERVRLEPGSDTMPSAVVLIDGRWRVGQAALNARRSHPQAFVATPKARLGHEPQLLGEEPVSATTMVSQVLTAVREQAVRTAGGTPPDQVVLTHPEHWGPRCQAALREAARLAGFPDEQITMLPEPIAAVRASVELTSLPPGSRVVVVDVGGGTCDVAVLEYTPDRGLVVVAREGDERLGGNDLDDLLYQWTLGQLRASGRDDMVEILTDPAHIGAALTLLDSVRGAKQDLSFHADAHIAVSVAADNETTITITRDEYEQIITEPLDRVAALTRKAMEASGTTAITQLFLTGGSAFTPALARALHTVTGHLSTPLGDPKMATATGALRTVLQIDAPAAAESPAAAQPTGPVPVGTPPRNPTLVDPAMQAPTAAIPPVPPPPVGGTTAAPQPYPARSAPMPGPSGPATVRGPKDPRRTRNRVLLMTIPAMVALGLGTWFGVAVGPAVFGEASPTATVTVAGPTVTAKAPAPGRTSSTSTPSQSADPDTPDPSNPATLTLGNTVAEVSACGRWGGDSWSDSSATMAHTYFRTAFACNLEDTEDHPSLDYLVPAGVTTFTATVGLDDSSVLTTSTVRYDVIDVTGNTSLGYVDVRYGETAPVSLPVEGLLRIRLETTMISKGDGSGGATAVWASPKWS